MDQDPELECVRVDKNVYGDPFWRGDRLDYELFKRLVRKVFHLYIRGKISLPFRINAPADPEVLEELVRYKEFEIYKKTPSWSYYSLSVEFTRGRIYYTIYYGGRCMAYGSLDLASGYVTMLTLRGSIFEWVNVRVIIRIAEAIKKLVEERVEQG